MASHFADRLCEAVQKKNTPLIVGLIRFNSRLPANHPHPAKKPPEGFWPWKLTRCFEFQRQGRQDRRPAGAGGQNQYRLLRTLLSGKASRLITPWSAEAEALGVEINRRRQTRRHRPYRPVLCRSPSAKPRVRGNGRHHRARCNHHQRLCRRRGHCAFCRCCHRPGQGRFCVGAGQQSDRRRHSGLCRRLRDEDV